ncbi:unnamed protein product [Ectocarpus sp. CCAP 1310/34]|nr:unnamed protein product [Ectocarpus sp. CCAP 1310/34]
MQVDRTIEIRGEERVVRQQRKNHIRGILLISQLLRKGTTEAAGKPVQSVVADEVELLEKGREHVEGIRERASKRGKRQPAAAAAASSAAAKKAKRKGADAALSDPLALAHDGGTRRGATSDTSREEAVAEERRSSAMDLMQNDPVLMERVRAMLDAVAAEQAAAKVAAIDAVNTRALCASMQAVKQHCNSLIGCTLYNTNHDIAPKIAASEGCYVYNEHKTRSDVTNPGNRGGAGGGAGYLKSCVGVQTDDFVVGAAGDKVLTARKWAVDESRARKWAARKKFTRSWKLRVRGASCYCSTCRIGCYDDCMVAKVYPDLVGEKSGKEMVGRRTLGTQLTGVILPVISSDESPVAPTLDESMGEEEEEEGEEEGEREEAQYVSSRGRVSIAKKRFPEVG